MKETSQLSLKLRLRRWRDFRAEIKDIDAIVDRLRAVVDFWKTTPLGTREIDPYDESSWPNPWTMLEVNKYDENVIALGMAYTLHYIGHDCRILYVQHVKNSEIKLIVLVDETYILNYNYDSVDTVEVMKEFEVLKDISISTLTES